jgi:4a-hydroxytetrahydrobiopterin dehydratase
MTELRRMFCVPCSKNEPISSVDEIQMYMQELSAWEVVEREGTKQLERSFIFENFRNALDFSVKVGNIAEEQHHHPVIITEWGKVTVTWWTHAINGLHKNDFIMASRTDELYTS